MVRAQHANNPVRIGFVPLGSPENKYDQSLVEAFRQGLRLAGLLEGRDVILDVIWSHGRPGEAVSEALKRGAGMLVPCGSSASVEAKRQTSTIPIIFLSVGDPIAMGLVESFAHPGRNATGFSDNLADLSGKLVELAKDMSVERRIVEYFWYTAWPDGQNRYNATEQAVRAAGMTLRPRGITDIAQLDGTFVANKRNRRENRCRSAQSFHIWTTGSDHCIGCKKWAWHNFRISSSCKRRVFDRVWPRLSSHVSSSASLRRAATQGHQAR
jgi:putative ABC transport system substrate-binding protein